MRRDEILSALKSKPEISVLVVGGGINGIGTFRDLAVNGVDDAQRMVKLCPV